MDCGRVESQYINDLSEIVHDSGEIAAPDSYTKLLIHGDSLSDATGKTITTTGAVVSTAQYKFTNFGRSILFDGDNDYLSLADSDDWNLGSGNFTIDFWVYHNSVDTTAEAQNYFSQWTGSSGYDQVRLIFYDHSKSLIFFAYQTAGVGFAISCSFDPTVSTWYHIALVRKGTTSADWNIYINGVAQTITLIAGNYSDTMPDLALPLEIGRINYNPTPTQYLNGYISEFRWSKGIARWTTEFTPPTADYGGARTFHNITGLDGDVDEEYVLIERIIGGYDGNGISSSRFNEDGGSNYIYQQVGGRDTAVNSYNQSATTNFFTTAWNTYIQLNKTHFAITNIIAKSGYLRTCKSYIVESISTTTVDGVNLIETAWKNTADNLVSINWLGTGSGVYGVGTRFILLRKVAISSKMRTGVLNVKGTVKYAWQKVYEETISEAVANRTISSLDGNTDVLYRLTVRALNSYGGNVFYVTILNGDNADNYGYQYLSADSSTLGAGRDTAFDGLAMGYAGTTQYDHTEMYMYVKSGFVRPALHHAARQITASAIGSTIHLGNVYSNTSDNITSMRIGPASGYGGAGNLGIGTYILLERLNL